MGDMGDLDNFLCFLFFCDFNCVGFNVFMWCDSDFDFLLDLVLEVNKLCYCFNLYY